MAATLAALTGLLAPTASTAVGVGPGGPDVESPSSMSGSPVLIYGGASAASNDVWLVGLTVDLTATVARHWDGTTWVSVPTPSPCNGYNALFDVDVASSRDAWAVGGCGSGDERGTLAEHWNGTSWKVVPTPDVGTSDELQSVDVVNHHDAWALGLDTSTGRSFLEVWDGKTWTLVDGTGDQLFDLSAVSDTDVWSTDRYVQHWDGSTWHYTNVQGFVDAVQAISSDDVWVAGSLLGHRAGDFTAHYDGTAWTKVRVPKVSGSRQEIRDVDAVSSTDVWATGLGWLSGHQVGHVLQWNGTHWTTVQDHSQPGSAIIGITASGPDEAWAFGFLGGGAGANAEHWDGKVWKLYILT